MKAEDEKLIRWATDALCMSFGVSCAEGRTSTYTEGIAVWSLKFVTSDAYGNHGVRGQKEKAFLGEDDDDGGYKTVPTPITRTFRLCIITIIVNTY